MTSIRDLLGEVLGVGNSYCLVLEEREGTLVADHPNEASPMNIAVVDGLDVLEERPPNGPVEVEIVGEVVDGRIAGRIVGVDCSEPDNPDPERSP